MEIRRVGEQDSPAMRGIEAAELSESRFVSWLTPETCHWIALLRKINNWPLSQSGALPDA
jgi:hypothetical protein